MTWTTSIIVCVLAYPIVLLLIHLASPRPKNLGLTDGQLSSCPASPNCVCTQNSDESHLMEPWSYEPADTKTAQKVLQQILTNSSRTNIVEAEDMYYRAEMKTFLLRYTDDVEFSIDQDHKLIHFRSASRLGYSDLGANRARMENLKKEFFLMLQVTGETD